MRNWRWRLRYWSIVKALEFAAWLAAGPYRRGILADAEGDSGYCDARRDGMEIVW